MFWRNRSFVSRLGLIFTIALAMWGLGTGRGSDHDDTPQLKSIGRHDARITDLYAFRRGDKLVLVLCTNPAVPSGVTEYLFPSDLTLRLFIDNNSKVRFNRPDDLAEFGGTIMSPRQVKEDIVLEVTFDEEGSPQLRLKGLPRNARKQISFFAGLRDDPFIRGPRIGRNVAAIVIELPLALVLAEQPTLLIWATSQVPEISGPMADMGGRALRSQFAENLAMNTMPPKEQMDAMGMQPDVIIFNTARPDAFPNGRELTDDVVDLVGDSRVLSNDNPFPSTNDAPFLEQFPYLASPH
jgi:hypothetical protein